jgi:UDP-2,3-diacylglucosamine pyrophosphatase LpxH
MMGLEYWSFSSWAKLRVKKAVNFIGSFQKVLADEAKRCGVEGVICGHIHHAVIEKTSDVEYINTGDWVESCTAVVEHFDGQMEILRWSHVQIEAPPSGDVLVPIRIDARLTEAA